MKVLLDFVKIIFDFLKRTIAVIVFLFQLFCPVMLFNSYPEETYGLEHPQIIICFVVCEFVLKMIIGGGVLTCILGVYYNSRKEEEKERCAEYEKN